VAATLDDDGYVWVTNTTSETMSTIDADQPDRQASSRQLGFRPGGIAFADGFLWVIDTQSDSVQQIDAQRPNPPGTIPVGAGPAAIAAGGGAVWVANELDQSLSRIQIGLTSADTAIPLDFVPGALALDPDTDALWIVDAESDALVRFDTRSRDEVARIEEVGARPVAVAVGAGSVWAASATGGTVTRINPETNTVVATIHVGGVPQGLAVFGTTVWVAVAES
jgi:YVTN family beta-propeller protein